MAILIDDLLPDTPPIHIASEFDEAELALIAEDRERWRRLDEQAIYAMAEAEYRDLFRIGGDDEYDH